MSHLNFTNYLAKTTRPLLLDGGMGTVLQSYNLQASDFGGDAHQGCFEYLAVTNPAPLQKAHEAYLAAGADILETCTFGASPVVLQEFGLAAQAYQINLASARLTKALAEKATTPAQPRWVAGSLGPTTKSLSLKHLTFAEMVDNYYPQVLGLIDGGVDYLLLETANDPLTLKAARMAVLKVCREKHLTNFPLAISATFAGTQMLAGHDIGAFWAIAEAWRPIYLGLNCITQEELPLLDFLLAHATVPVAVMPNNGLPDEHGRYPQTPAAFVQSLRPYLAKGLKLVGGCCGTTPEHIAALKKELPSIKLSPSAPPVMPSVLAGTSILNLEQKDPGKVFIAGERANVLGAKSFREVVQKQDWTAATEIAKSQIKTGAHILDLCFAHPEGQEKEDCLNFLQHAASLLKVPLMIDSINLEVVAAALEKISGKSIINSANLEHGEEHFKKFLALAKDFGAALVVGTIDQKGMALEASSKLEVAQHIMQICHQENFPEEDLYFDPLVFPCASGDEKYRGKAWATIEALTLLKKQFPRSKTILGISNVSFGLPSAARAVLNAVFLHHACLHGLDVAIANPLHVKNIQDFDPALTQTALALLQGNLDAKTFADKFRGSTAAARPGHPGKGMSPSSSPLPALTLPAKIQQRLVEGTLTGLTDDLNELLKTKDALSIINEVLLPGMQIVGKLFDQQKLIIAEVLQAAQVMKAAIDCLKPSLPVQQKTSKAKMLLATVKGDVHDIGKNLVDIILSNNGFTVIDLGIKVPSEVIIKAYHEHHPDMIGLSGLLVKSAYQMASMAQDFTAAGIKIPLLVGGAALSEKFTQETIAPHYQGEVYYNKDAMHCLLVMEQLAARMQNSSSPALNLPSKGLILNEQKNLKSTPDLPLQGPRAKELKSPISSESKVIDLAKAPDFSLHLETTSIWDLAPHLHPIFYTRHIGLNLATAQKIVAEKRFPREIPASLLNAIDPKYHPTLQALHEVLTQYADTHLRGKAVYRFVPCYAQGDQIVLLDPLDQTKILGTWHFTRQKVGPYLCLSDWIRPQDAKDFPDNLACFVATVGQNIRQAVQELKKQGAYLKSHLLAAYALESAQTYAAIIHQKIRRLWQLAPEQGQRFSFGHSSCPLLENQKLLFAYLGPEQIGVSLTDEFMMDPEASVSAIVMHHPQATYFDALKRE